MCLYVCVWVKEGKEGIGSIMRYDLYVIVMNPLSLSLFYNTHVYTQAILMPYI